jgi:hypothetical protein
MQRLFDSPTVFRYSTQERWKTDTVQEFRIQALGFDDFPAFNAGKVEYRERSADFRAEELTIFRHSPQEWWNTDTGVSKNWH